MMDHEKLKTLLDNEYVWPAYYLFKFIVPKDECTTLKELDKSIRWIEKPSQKGNYISLTAQVYCHSSEEVLYIYRQAITIKGIVAL